MPYELETVKQSYGSQEYLAHKLKGTTPADDRYFFGSRIPSYGIINFGAMGANTTKQFKPLSKGINSDIALESLYLFSLDGSKGEVTFRLFDGTVKIAEWIFGITQLPYQFPKGAIINPNLTLEVQPKFAISQCLIYWQPVHTLSYLVA